MKNIAFLFLLAPLYLFSQKKLLDHSVYDGWQSIDERLISNDGKWVVFTIVPQEGDAVLHIQSTQPGGYKKQIPRGYTALITHDSRFVVFKIKPEFKEIRDARIRKKKPEEMPKDSIGVLELGKDSVFKSARIKSYKAPTKAAGWVAYHKEAVPQRGIVAPTQKAVDSLKKTIDSLTLLVTQLKNLKAGHADAGDADEDPAPGSPPLESSDLVVRHLQTGREKIFRYVVDYTFNTYGQKLAMRIARSPRDASSANAIILYDLQKGQWDTILKNGNDFKGLVFSDDGAKLAFVAETDTNRKARQKFYELYLFREGGDSAHLLISRHSGGMAVGHTVSENAVLSFSRSGNRLFFGTAPIQPVKDTSVVEIDQVKLDIWHYKDDYLQTQQLNRLATDLKRSYLAVFDFTSGKMEQLGSAGIPNVTVTNEGEGNNFIAITDTGRRVESQWTGTSKKDVYALIVKTGEKRLVKKNHDGPIYPSATGRYVLLYDNKSRHYFAWDGNSLKNISSKIKFPLYNEENDVPGDPNPYGVMGWHEDDSSVYIYDRYDVWKVDPAGAKVPLSITRGREGHYISRYVATDADKKFFRFNDTIAFKIQNDKNKKTGYTLLALHNAKAWAADCSGVQVNNLLRSKNGSAFIYTKEHYSESPNLYLVRTEELRGTTLSPGNSKKLTALNPQQSRYNWGTAELYHWKAFNGKPATGILYKPEDFDSAKKYPMIIYFYEKLSDGLYNYIAPAPTPSRLNIPFFVSRGYLVLAPDIVYTKGHPGKDAYNFIVSGAQALGKKKWVDAKNIGIQGQSWGGYQVAYLVTATNMFKAAWAGAPVVNMFSAYGGIRWESGNNRQSQYEKGQSRIGATPWERPNLYIENSPFFHLNKIQTPLVIMANDADGAVPWYQGIEFFTAMRRLGKKVWLLNYNGEAHNLVERKNRKDIQIREQQYFDWLLKGEQPAGWITDGVPAIKKGRDWGLELTF